MASSTLTEFLVKLGFVVDDNTFHKFSNTLASVGKQVVAISTALVAAEAALVSFTTKIATELSSLYYSAQRTGTTIQSLTNLGYALEQTGNAGVNAAAVINDFSLRLRDNPALIGYFHGLGVATVDASGKARDMQDVWLDTLEVLRKMPPWIADQRGSLFGFTDEEIRNIDPAAIRKKEAEDRGIQKNLDFDPDKFGAMAVTFMQSVSRFTEDLTILGEKVAVRLFPGFTEDLTKASHWIETHGKQLADIGVSLATSFGSVVDHVTTVALLLARVLERTIGVKNAIEIVAVLSGNPVAQAIVAMDVGGQLYDWLKSPEGQKAIKHDTTRNDLGVAGVGAAGDAGTAGGLFAESVLDALKRFYNWTRTQPAPDAGASPMGWSGGAMQATPISFNQGGGMSGGGDLLDRVRMAESGGNDAAVSPTGAQGPYQFMPGTWARWGQGSPFDPTAARAAAGRYLNYLLQMFGGNVAEALAGYNWGEGNVAADVSRWGDAWLQHAPLETQSYVNRILGGSATGGGGSNVHVEHHNTNHIRSSDPTRVAEEVARLTHGTWSDVIRNLRGSVNYA